MCKGVVKLCVERHAGKRWSGYASISSDVQLFIGRSIWIRYRPLAHKCSVAAEWIFGMLVGLPFLSVGWSVGPLISVLRAALGGSVGRGSAGSVGRSGFCRVGRSEGRKVGVRSVGRSRFGRSGGRVRTSGLNVLVRSVGRSGFGWWGVHGSLETFGDPQRHAIAHLKAGKMVIPNMLSVMLGKSVLF